MTDTVPDSFELPIELEKEFTSSICPTHSSSLLSAIHRQFKAQSVVDEYCTTDDGCESDYITDSSSDSDNGEDRLDVDDEIENVHWVEADEAEEGAQMDVSLEANHFEWRDVRGCDVRPTEEDTLQAQWVRDCSPDFDHHVFLKDLVSNRVYPVAILLQCRPSTARFAEESSPDRATCQVKPYWKEQYTLPSKKTKPKSKTESKSTRQMSLAARSVLGKLTVENTDLVITQLMDLGFDRADNLPLLLDQIFELAVQHHQRLAVYSELCARLAHHPHITSMVYSTGMQLCFRRLLHTYCEGIFQDLLDAFDKRKATHEESDHERKQRTLGSVKFVAQLIVIGLLPSSMLVECAEKLLSRHDICSEPVEVLTALLMIAGPKFDHVGWPFYSGFDALFSKMKLAARNKGIPSRARFLLRDVMEVRSAGWALGTSLVPSQLALTQVEQDATQLCIVMQQSGNREQRSQIADTAAVETPNASGPEDVEAFDVVVFRRALAGALSDLSVNRDIQVAVDLVRSCNVPLGQQADQFTDILTRVVEDRRGPCRRCALAFAVRIAADSVFDQGECLLGLSLFFQDVYPDLRVELPRLPAIVAKELLPALHAVFPQNEVKDLLPVDLQSQ